LSALKIKTKPVIKQVVTGLAEDLKQLIFDIIYDPQFSSLKENLNFSEEWSRSLITLKKEQARTAIKNLQQRLQELDRKAEKTETEETEFNDLLRQIAYYQQILRSTTA